MSNSINSTQSLLDVLSQFVKDMNSSNSNLHKEDTFRNYSDKYSDRNGPFLKSIVLVNNNLIPFYVTASNINKFKNDKKKQGKNLKVESYPDGKDKNGNVTIGLFDMLFDLHLRNLSGDKAKKSILAFIKKYPEHESLILNIIDKDIEIRFTGRSINNVVNGLVPLFKVSLGEKYDKSTKKYLDKPWNNGWYISRKLDGVRCICKITENDSDEDISLKKVDQKDINSFFKNTVVPKPKYDIKFLFSSR